MIHGCFKVLSCVRQNRFVDLSIRYTFQICTTYQTETFLRLIKLKYEVPISKLANKFVEVKFTSRSDEGGYEKVM